MTPAIHNITSELLVAVAHLQALHSDATVIPWGRCWARERVFALADKLNTERARPMTDVIASWTPFNARNSYKPGSAL